MFDSLRETLERFSKNKYFVWVRAILRGLGQYILYAMIFWACADAISMSFHSYETAAVEKLPYPHVWEAATLVLFSVFILNSMLFIFAVFDSVMRKRFFASRGQNKSEEKTENEENPLPNLFLIEFGTLVLCCFLFPVWSAYDGVVALIPISLHLPQIVHRLIFTVVFALISFLLVLHVEKNVQGHWLQKQTDAYKRKGYVANQEVNRTAYRKRKFILQIIGYSIGYYIVACIFCYLIPTCYSLVEGILLLLREWAFFLIIGAVAFLIVGRAFWKRLKFYIRLQRLCKKYCFRIVEKKQFFLSLFHTGDSYHFAIKANGETYYCKMIATLRRKNRLRFLPDGSFKRISGVHLPTPQVMVQSRFAMGAIYIDSSHVDEREMFRFEREGRYAFDCKEGGRKILLLNPVPRRAMLGAATCEGADHGDKIGEYSVYGGSAFLNALKNDAFYFDKYEK